MFKSKFAGAIAAGLLFSIASTASAASAGSDAKAVGASGSKFTRVPMYPNARAVFPSNFPVSVNETAPSEAQGPQLPRTAMSLNATAPRVVFASSFPMSVNENAPSEIRRADIGGNVGATGISMSPLLSWRIPGPITPTFPRSVSDHNPSQ